MVEYQRMNRESAGRFAGILTPLLVYGAAEALERGQPDGALILNFESMEDAKA